MPPKKPPNTETTVVGIGASAGGLAALKTLLSNVTVDSDLAFVVVVHLSPDHESHLAELLQPHSSIPVSQVSQNTLLERNHVYIIPPNSNLNAIDTHLRLSKLESRRQERAPIDHFFRTLANTHDGHAIAVVLTGTGSDGTLGIKDVKANGGVVIVQDPTEAEYDGMPQSAIATGLVDFVLPVADIPENILKFNRVQPRLPIPPTEEDVPADERVLLQRIFAHLRVRTERDFSRYKRSTVLRRIARRMQLNYTEDLSNYVERLRESSEEARALADDLLITVTHFFRDPEVFERLERVEIPRLFSRESESDTIRAWSVGCATGEEAYSLAMLMVEESGKHEKPPQVQVFASDLHVGSLERAREGIYPGDISTDISPERLKRFFHQEHDAYRIRKEIRDMVVFAPHNVLADPPFSRLDLISCRNLLIYLERDVQQDVIELFHYALNPDGTLMLGSAESIDASDLFRVEDKRLCFFRKRNIPSREPRLPVFPLTRNRSTEDVNGGVKQTSPPIVYGMLHQKMLEKYSPPSILIGGDNRIVHLSEHAGRYLVAPGGEPTQNAIKLVRAELRVDLQSAIHHAREKKQTFDSLPIPVQFNGHAHPVVLHVRPSMEREEDGFVLVIFEERDEVIGPAVEGNNEEQAESERIRDLNGEVDAGRRRLQIIIEEHEASKEEMKASNEELQSANEELRSTMEELETSKEELRSINEELQTVNQQNRHKVEELAQLSSDLQNLLVATDIATLFLDRELRILRFTPKLGELFNIRMTDRGRPISDLTHRLVSESLADDALTVLANLVPILRELRDDQGRVYLTRIHPYRSSADRIEGIVVTFVDVTDRRETDRIRAELAQNVQAAASEKMMREKEAELARFSRIFMMGELATSIAHEVNQPLAGVVTNAEAALRWLEAGGGDLKEAKNSLSLIVRDGNRASAVIKRVRDFVKKGSDEATLLDIRTVLRETAALVRADLEKNQVVLNFMFPDRIPAVRADRVQLEQVILNLISNASDAMATITGRPRDLKISAEESADDTVLVSFGDSGIGIDKDQIDRVFDAFFTTKPSGIGMGLSISRSIVEAAGGTLSVVPNKGAGVTVQFSLPTEGRPTS